MKRYRTLRAVGYSRGDMVTAGLMGPAPIYVDRPGPQMDVAMARKVGTIAEGDIALVIDVTDDDHMLVTCNGIVGVVLIATVRLIDD